MSALEPLLSWSPAPSPAGTVIPQLRALALTLALCLALGALSLAPPLAAAGHPLGVGARLLLFCHLG